MKKLLVTIVLLLTLTFACSPTKTVVSAEKKVQKEASIESLEQDIKNYDDILYSSSKYQYSIFSELKVDDKYLYGFFNNEEKTKDAQLSIFNKLSNNDKVLSNKIKAQYQAINDIIFKQQQEIESINQRLDSIDLVDTPIEPEIELKAFPNVKGAGSNVTGGRGGIVVYVTNLNNSGTGSLREALMMKVPRNILFTVSGNIRLNSAIELTLENSNFTVWGQSAPLGGITISNHLIQFGGGYNRPSQPCNNIILRYLRFRNGGYTGASDVREHNGILSTGCDGLVIDHCSFSFCDDQAISMGGNYGNLENITIQNSIFSDNATNIILGLNPSFPTGKITIINNAFIDTNQRTPNIGGTGQYDVINNYYFNWVGRLSNINGGSPKVNYIGNYMQEGDYTTPRSGNKYQAGDASIYTSKNYHSSLYIIPIPDDRKIWQDFFSSAPVSSSRFTTNIFPILEDVVVEDALTIKNKILLDVGANRYIDNSGNSAMYQDTYDILKINNAKNNISSNPGNKNWTIPNIPLNIRGAEYDTDKDGMCDSWELNKFGNLNKKGSDYVEGNPYTIIEQFMYQYEF